jgi:NADP-dependent 3-hydroxy acid dehydrogenase YdfG
MGNLVNQTRLLSNETVLITGASGGIGQSVSFALAQQGASLCLCGRNRARLNQIAARVPEQKAHCYPADLTVEKELKTTVDAVLADNRRLDILIHCAAIFALGAVATASAEDFERQFRTNVLMPFRLTQLLLPSLIQAQGQVVFFNSSAGLNARSNVSQYAATKHALRAVADGLREECNSSGVRVCSFFLGDTATEMQAAIRAQQGRTYEPKLLIQPEDVAAMVVAVLTLPRTSEVTNVMIRPMAKT